MDGAANPGRHAVAEKTEQQEEHEPGVATKEDVDRVENKLDALIDVVNGLLPGTHGEAEQRTSERLDRPSSIEEQVKAELAKAEARRKQDEDAAAAKAEHESTRERLARLEELPPEPPARRATKLLGWGG